MPLKSAQTTVNVINSNDLMTWLAEITGKSRRVDLLEASNDSDHYFADINGDRSGAEYNLECFENMASQGSIEVWNLAPILETLCLAGKLEPGNYLVRVSW